METRTEILIAVGEQTLSSAELRIAGCSNCTDRADTLFEQILDDVVHCGEPAAYILPSAASCPMCQGEIFENTPVQRRERARELFFVDERPY